MLTIQHLLDHLNDLSQETRYYRTLRNKLEKNYGEKMTLDKFHPQKFVERTSPHCQKNTKENYTRQMEAAFLSLVSKTLEKYPGTVQDCIQFLDLNDFDFSESQKKTYMSAIRKAGENFQGVDTPLKVILETLVNGKLKKNLSTSLSEKFVGRTLISVRRVLKLWVIFEGEIPPTEAEMNELEKSLKKAKIPKETSYEELETLFTDVKEESSPEQIRDSIVMPDGRQARVEFPSNLTISEAYRIALNVLSLSIDVDESTIEEWNTLYKQYKNLSNL